MFTGLVQEVGGLEIAARLHDDLHARIDSLGMGGEKVSEPA